MRKTFILLLGAALLGGCVNATVLDGDANVVWVKEPFIGSGAPQEVADRHCAQFGRQAVFERETELRDGKLRTVWIFVCKAPAPAASQ